MDAPRAGSPADPNARYDAVAVAIHWLTAATVLTLYVIGIAMLSERPGSPQQFQLYQLHKSLGIGVLLLTAVRIAWRLAHRPPPLPEAMPAWERRAAHAAHGLLYLGLIGLPLLGWATVSASPLNLPTVLFGTVPWPHLPFLADLPDRAAAARTLGNLHKDAAWIFLALLAVHVGAALRHHFLLHDRVLLRMTPRFRPGRHPDREAS